MASTLAPHHIAVVTRDLDRSVRFYEAALGLPVLRRHADAEGRPRAVWLGLGGGAFLAVELSQEPDVDPSRTRAKADSEPGWHCIALAIEKSERASWRARLAAAGAPVFRETAFTLYARDPDGAIVALSHYPEPFGE